MLEVEKRKQATDAVAKKKRPREELCTAVKGFAAALGNLAKFAKDKQMSCGIPAAFVQNITKAHTNVQQQSKQICDASVAGPGPAGPPSLSEALGTDRQSVTATTTSRPSTGTLNTLTGSVIAR